MKRRADVRNLWGATVALSFVMSAAVGCGGGSSPSATKLASIALSPASASIAVGAGQQFTATAAYTDGTTRDMSATVSWSSSSTSRATISKTGFATGVAVGTTTITATSGTVSGTATLAVTATPPNNNRTLNSIAVTPANASVAVGGAQQFTATGSYSDGTTTDLSAVTWASSSTPTATISSAGLATGVVAGTTMITATSAGVVGSTSLTVTAPKPATLNSITIAPANASMGVGDARQFAATGNYDDGSIQDLTGKVTWMSSMPATATISNIGLVTAVAKGMTTISASMGGITGMTMLNVTEPPMLMSIAITPASPTVAKGTTVQLTATGTYSDGNTKDISATVAWLSAATATATVSANGLVTGVAGGPAAITATSGSVMASTTVTVTEAVLSSIAVSPDGKTIATGTTQQFTATGTFKEPTTNATTTQDLTAMVTWSSDTVATATITSAGLATAKAVGMTVIKATSGSVSGTTTLSVKKADLMSIAVTTTTPSIATGTTATFVATGTFADMTTQDLTSQVMWASSVSGVATISDAGVAKGTGKGTSSISATLGSITGTLKLTVTDAVLVSIVVSAELPVPSATPTIAKNTKLQLDAIGTFSDQSKQDLTDTVTWASSANAASVSNAAASKGLVTAGNAAGTTTISAQVGTGSTAVKGTLILAISNETLASIAIRPNSATIAAGTTQQFGATGFFTDGSTQDLTETVAWTSATPAAATISNVAGSKGLAKGVAVGSSVITASFSVGNNTAVTQTATLTVSKGVLQTIDITPAAPTVALGTTITLGVQGTYSDGSKQDLTTTVTWASAMTSVATISNATGSNGKVTPVAKGPTMITATYSVTGMPKVTGTVTLTVTDALLTSIAITAAKPTTIEKGTTLQLTAIGTFTDGMTVDLTKTVTWASDKTTVATVSNTASAAGLVTAVGTGSASIGATSTSAMGQLIVGTTLAVTVNDGTLRSIAVTPATAAIAPGTKLQFVATGTFDDGAKQDITNGVTWASDTSTTATIDGAGLAAAIATGSAKITATQGTGAAAIAGSTMLTVTTGQLKSIVLKPQPTVSIAKGTAVQFSATGFFDDATTQDLTDTATFVSSMTGVATISNDPASNGLATGIATGGSSITASVLIGTTTVTSAGVQLTVTPQTLASVAITPATPSVAKGAPLSLHATGTFTDGSTQDLTNAVTWASAVTATATVSNANNQKGRVTALATGTVEITATSNAASGSKVAHVTLTVTAAAIASIAITPVNPAPGTTVGHTQQFVAEATLTDGTKKDVSATVTWTSTTQATATISSAGLATGIAAGTTQISAASAGITSNTVTLTVTN